MTEPPIQYQAEPELPTYFVDCVVSVPGDTRDDTTGRYLEVRCPARLSCPDLIDKLNLDRWTTQAFQLIWRSGKAATEKARERLIAQATWFMQRGFTHKRHWQATTVDVVALALEEYGKDPEGAKQLAKAIRDREPWAMSAVGELWARELNPSSRGSL